LIWSYCAAYILLGTLLFSNFYPFTWFMVFSVSLEY
jgi:hypothetical protein